MNLFKFSSLQSDYSIQFLSNFNSEFIKVDSVILVSKNKIYTKSSAVLNILKLLKGGYQILYILILIPQPIRDWVYDYIATHRYQWFGKQKKCLLPNNDIKHKFL